MNIIYTTQRKPIIGYSIFLCGPSPRKGQTLNWRKDAISILEQLKFDGTVIVPEPENGEWPSNYDDVTDWEDEYLEQCDKIVFWVCRDYVNGIKGMTTNIEFGLYYKTGKVIYGRPTNADDIRNLDKRYKKQYGLEPHISLETLLETTVSDYRKIQQQLNVDSNLLFELVRYSFHDGDHNIKFDSTLDESLCLSYISTLKYNEKYFFGTLCDEIIHLTYRKANSTIGKINIDYNGKITIYYKFNI